MFESYDNDSDSRFAERAARRSTPARRSTKPPKQRSGANKSGSHGGIRQRRNKKFSW